VVRHNDSTVVFGAELALFHLVNLLVKAEGDELARPKLWRNACLCARTYTECNRRGSACCDADACPKDRAASCTEGPAWPRDCTDRIRRGEGGQEPFSLPLAGRQGLRSVDSNPNRAAAFDTQLSEPYGRLRLIA